jgi:hypothetical protein
MPQRQPGRQRIDSIDCGGPAFVFAAVESEDASQKLANEVVRQVTSFIQRNGA